MGKRRYAVRLSGVGSGDQRCGRMRIHYCYLFSNPAVEAGLSGADGKVEEYAKVFPNSEATTSGSALMLNYKSSNNFVTSPYQGVSSVTGGSVNRYSIYRREYQVYQKPGLRIAGDLRLTADGGGFYVDGAKVDPRLRPSTALYVDSDTGRVYRWNSESGAIGYGSYALVDEAARVYKGEWQPVSVDSSAVKMRDFNVTAGRSYQYIMYPKGGGSGSKLAQIFANHKGEIWQQDGEFPGQGKRMNGTDDTAPYNGSPVSTRKWSEWSLIELIPQENDQSTPTVKRIYKADLDQLWLFKYSLETGSQTQNVSRSEFQTLGQYPRIGYGKNDYASGEVSALLGSEIIPYSDGGYVERLRAARAAPLSTNERAKMLAQWRSLVASKNPKLLRDMKGQSWIVQIFSSSNTPKNFYRNQPDTISFSWKQIADVEGAVITSGYGEDAESVAEGSQEWAPTFR